MYMHFLKKKLLGSSIKNVIRKKTSFRKQAKKIHVSYVCINFSFKGKIGPSIIEIFESANDSVIEIRHARNHTFFNPKHGQSVISLVSSLSFVLIRFSDEKHRSASAVDIGAVKTISKSVKASEKIFANHFAAKMCTFPWLRN